MKNIKNSLSFVVKTWLFVNKKWLIWNKKCSLIHGQSSYRKNQTQWKNRYLQKLVYEISSIFYDDTYLHKVVTIECVKSLAIDRFQYKFKVEVGSIFGTFMEFLS